eukprot:TRINITY_DN14924_c0_g1_i1.p3 TRINITY_DN14924_c0_g1~~TRINITY_DN14924_c0_g1_i1.p3  ORF type:complete len:134 (-),score=16.15 TRINITY_DN14924_c0_g1_i1:210-611(-)
MFFFLNDTATTEIYTLHIVGSVRCVQETVPMLYYPDSAEAVRPKDHQSTYNDFHRHHLVWQGQYCSCLLQDPAEEQKDLRDNHSQLHRCEKHHSYLSTESTCNISHLYMPHHNPKAGVRPMLYHPPSALFHDL